FEQRDPASHDLPQHLIKIREGNDDTVHYFLGREDLARFGQENPDLNLGLSGEKESDTTIIEKSKNGSTRRARHEELYESHAIQELLSKLAKKGVSIDHYSAQDKPPFELVEGEGETQQVKPLFSIPEILS